MKEFSDGDRLYLDDLQIGQRFTTGTHDRGFLRNRQFGIASSSLQFHKADYGRSNATKAAAIASDALISRRFCMSFNPFCGVQSVLWHAYAAVYIADEAPNVYFELAADLVTACFLDGAVSKSSIEASLQSGLRNCRRLRSTFTLCRRVRQDK